MVKNIFSILTARQSSILSGAAVIMVTVLLSKFLGLIRDHLLAHAFTTDKIDIFWAAFKLPDVIFQIAILGALSIAFIPVFTEYFEDKGKEEAFELARVVLNISLLVSLTGSVLVFIFANPISALLAPGFAPDKQDQVAELTRIIIFGQAFLVAGCFFIGILQSFQRFLVPSLAPVFYNLGIIAGIIFFSERFGIYGVGVGVILGALLHALVQLPLVWSMGFRFKWPIRLLHPGVLEIFKLVGFRTIGLAAEQVNELFGIILASLTAVGSVTYLTFAQHLQVVPIGLFGATLAQAALPVLSSERARGRIDEFKSTLLTTLHQIMFLTLPATAILIVLRIPAVRLVFGASQFAWTDTVLTGKTLAWLSVGLAAQSISLLLVRGFYALKDTKTPVVVSLIVVTINILLSLWFITILKQDVSSLGIAYSVSAILSSILLFSALHFKVGKFDLKLVLVPFGKMLMATIIMGMALYIPIKLLDQVIFDTTKTINLLVLTGLSSIFALSIYVFLVWFMKVAELVTFAGLLKRVFLKMSKWPKNINSEEIIHQTDTI